MRRKQVPIIELTRQGKIDAIRTLLSRQDSEADGSYLQSGRRKRFYLVNERDATGNHAVHAAAANDHRDILKLLVEAGAEIDVTNNAKKSPIGLAKENGHIEMASFLENLDKKIQDYNHDFIQIVSDNHYNSVKRIIEKCKQIEIGGETINISLIVINKVHTSEFDDASEYCAILTSASHNTLEIMKLLVDNGALLEATIWGLTALHKAEGNEEYGLEMKKYILEQLPQAYKGVFLYALWEELEEEEKEENRDLVLGLVPRSYAGESVLSELWADPEMQTQDDASSLVF